MTAAIYLKWSRVRQEIPHPDSNLLEVILHMVRNPTPWQQLTWSDHGNRFICCYPFWFFVWNWMKWFRWVCIVCSAGDSVLSWLVLAANTRNRAAQRSCSSSVGHLACRNLRCRHPLSRRSGFLPCRERNLKKSNQFAVCGTKTFDWLKKVLRFKIFSNELKLISKCSQSRNEFKNTAAALPTEEMDWSEPKTLAYLGCW